MFFGTSYELQSDRLYIRCGPLRMRIPYSEIESVRRGISILSLSLSFRFRCVIIKRRGRALSVSISPQSPERFIRELRERCPRSSDGGSEQL